MVAGVLAVAALEVGLGFAVANSTSAGIGVAVAATTFLIVVTLSGLRFRAGIGRWLSARKFARTNLELARLGDESIHPDELCESLLCMKRCTHDDASPLRRFDLDALASLMHPLAAPIPRVWVLTESGRAPIGGNYAPPSTDPLGHTLTNANVVRESYGRQSVTFALARIAIFCFLATLVVLIIVVLQQPCIGCTVVGVMAFVFAGLLQPRMVAFNDRLLATSPEGVWLVLKETAKRKRVSAINARAKQLGVAPNEIPENDRVLQSLPVPQIHIPWSACYVVLYKPRVQALKGAWRWRIYPPRDYWSAIGVRSSFVIEANALNPAHTPWQGIADVLKDGQGPERV